MTNDTEDTPLRRAKLYGDGGSRGNPGPSASGYVLMTVDDEIVVEKGIFLGITTNNQAEYKSLIYGLETALKMGVEDLSVFMDSELVIRQVKGQYKVKNHDLKPLHQEVINLAGQFSKITFTHVLREFNKLADAQVNKALDANATGI